MTTPHVEEPELPDGITAGELDDEARRDLRGLQKDTADVVAKHLVAAGMLVDEDPEQALAHARYARRRASRIAVVREAAGIVAYHAGEWNEALGELRAARRMGGGPGHLAVMADIERALGRPERALELVRSPEAKELGKAETIELAIVAAGARRDLGELDAAVVGLQIPELDPRRREPWSPRLFYAYADNLLAAGRESDALQWFVHTVDADVEGETDAAERIAELTGEPLDDDGVTFQGEDLLGPEPDDEADHDADDEAEPEPAADTATSAGGIGSEDDGAAADALDPEDPAAVASVAADSVADGEAADLPVPDGGTAGVSVAADEAVADADPGAAAVDAADPGAPAVDAVPDAGAATTGDTADGSTDGDVATGPGGVATAEPVAGTAGATEDADVTDLPAATGEPTDGVTSDVAPTDVAVADATDVDAATGGPTDGVTTDVAPADRAAAATDVSAADVAAGTGSAADVAATGVGVSDGGATEVAARDDGATAVAVVDVPASEGPPADGVEGVDAGADGTGGGGVGTSAAGAATAGPDARARTADRPDAHGEGGR